MDGWDHHQIPAPADRGKLLAGAEFPLSRRARDRQPALRTGTMLRISIEMGRMRRLDLKPNTPRPQSEAPRGKLETNAKLPQAA